jgi:hypothetical protein
MTSPLVPFDRSTPSFLRPIQIRFRRPAALAVMCVLAAGVALAVPSASANGTLGKLSPPSGMCTKVVPLKMRPPPTVQVPCDLAAGFQHARPSEKRDYPLPHPQLGPSSLQKGQVS